MVEEAAGFVQNGATWVAMPWPRGIGIHELIAPFGKRSHLECCLSGNCRPGRITVCDIRAPRAGKKVFVALYNNKKSAHG